MKAISSLCLFYHVGSILKASPSLNLKVAVAVFSGGSRPSDKDGGGGWGGGSLLIQTLRSEEGCGLQQKIFSALRASVWSKNKGPPLHLPLVLSLTLHDRSHYISRLSCIFVFYLMTLKQQQSSKVSGPKS